MNEDKKLHDHQLMMDGLYWWGVPTLFRCAHEKKLANCDIGLVGVPTAPATARLSGTSTLGPAPYGTLAPLAAGFI